MNLLPIFRELKNNIPLKKEDNVEGSVLLMNNESGSIGTTSIASFATGSFTHSMTIPAANPGTFTDLLVWTSNPNGVTDSLPTNDTIAASFFISSLLYK